MKSLATIPMFALVAASAVLMGGCSSDTMARMNQKHPSALDRIASISPDEPAAPEEAAGEAALAQAEPGLDPVAEAPRRSPAWGSSFNPY